MKRIFSLIWVLGVLFLACGCGRNQSYEHSEIVMDTVVSLSAQGPESRAAVEESFQRLKEIEAMADAGRPDSDLAKLEAAAGQQAVTLHPEIYRMLEVSQDFSAATAGAWDVTTGPLVRLWGIGTDKARVPSAKELQEARHHVGWQKLHLHPEDHSAELEEAGMSLDLGGMAKGFAVDEVRRIYKAHGIKDGLINMGASSLYAAGQAPSNKPWHIGLRHPRAEEKDRYLAVLPLTERALSTSGDYERYFEQDGRRYCHIIDPRTGCPAQSGIMSDTVVMPGDEPEAGMLTDLLSTAVFILGPSSGQELLGTVPGAEAAIITSDYQIDDVGGLVSHLQEIDGDFSLLP
jgi:thiamine biosynthesis lipoprotein